MITGYNNDIKHRGTVFHVQTEDKGEASAWIESLIYTGGRILARKRVTYKQLLDEGADKPAIAKLMERQHRLMIHQIRDGRFDEETSDGVPAGATPSSEEGAEIHTTRIQQQAEAMFAPPGATGSTPSGQLEAEAAAAREEVDEESAQAEEPAEVEASEGVSEPEVGEDEGEEKPDEAHDVDEEEAEEGVEAPGTETSAATTAAEEEASDGESAAGEADDVSTDAADSGEEPAPVVSSVEEEDDDVHLEVGPAPTLDQVIFDYLSSVAQEESLVLLMDESPALATGTTTRMDLGTHASRSGKPISDASIAVRMISKTGGPVTLAEGTTDDEGTLQLVVEVPDVERDSAALIITASSSIGNAEIKHLL